MDEQNRWKILQNSMALSGLIVSDEDLQRLAEEYEAKGMDELALKIVAISEQTGRSMLEVAKEILAHTIPGESK